MTKRKLGGVILGVAAGGASIFVSMSLFSHGGREASPPETAQEAIYYVDGARPSVVPGVVSATDPELPEGCVPYSPARPDVMICGDIREGWQPPPKPYYDQAICDAALEWLGAQKSPEVRVESCLVHETRQHMWWVVFDRVDGSDNVHVPFDPTGTDPRSARL